MKMQQIDSKVLQWTILRLLLQPCRMGTEMMIFQFMRRGATLSTQKTCSLKMILQRNKLLSKTQVWCSKSWLDMIDSLTIQTNKVKVKYKKQTHKISKRARTQSTFHLSKYSRSITRRKNSDKRWVTMFLITIITFLANRGKIQAPMKPNWGHNWMNGSEPTKHLRI